MTTTRHWPAGINRAATIDPGCRATLWRRHRGSRWQADGNLAATAIDLGRFARMLLGGGQLDGTKILSTNAFEAMVSRLAPSGEDVLDLHGVAATESSRYGLGINVERCAGHTVLTHGGGMVGYASFLIADLDAGLAVCVLTNANGDTPVAEAIARCTAAELVGPGQVDINRLDPRWWDAAHVEKAASWANSAPAG